MCILFLVIYTVKIIGETEVLDTGNDVLSAQGCLDIGFNKDVLKCNACVPLGRVLPRLLSACESCCSPGATIPREVFALIVLEIDKRFVEMNMYPEIGLVIKKSQELELSSSASLSSTRLTNPYANFTIRYTFGARPMLHLFKDRDDEFPEDSVQIGGWAQRVIEDFLAESSL